MRNYLAALRTLNRDARLALLTSALLGFAVYGGIYFLLLNLYLLRLGYDEAFVGRVNAVGQLAYVVFTVPAGILGTRWGSRRVMALGLGLSGLGLGLLPFGELLLPGSLSLWLQATYAVGFLGIGMYIVNINPYLAGTTTPEHRSHAYSAQIALWPLAGFCGSLLGGFLPGLFAHALDLPPGHVAGFRYALALAAAILLTGVVILARASDTDLEHHRPSPGASGALPVTLILVIGGLCVLQTGAEMANRVFYNVYMDRGAGAPTELIGIFAAAGQLLAVPVALAATAAAARIGRVATIALGSLATAAAIVPAVVVPHWTVVGGSCMAVIAASSLRRPIVILFQQELVAPRWRVAMSTVTTMAAGISASLVAFAGGHLIPAAGFGPLYLACAAVSVLGAAGFAWVFGRRHSYLSRGPDGRKR